MLVQFPWYSRSTTSQRPARSTTTFGLTSLIALSHWFGQGCFTAGSLGEYGVPLQAGGVAKRAPISWTSGPNTTPQPRMPLSERT